MDPARAKRYVISVLEAVHGNISEAAKSMNMGRRTVTRWVSQNPELRQALDRIRMGEP
jgi:ActR/RegA family two-component response regulator